MHEQTRLSAEAYAASVKGAPPLAVAAMSVAGVGLQDWVFIATLAYIALQSAYLLWKWVRDIRAKKAKIDA